jgi:UDP-N-acetylmuramate dehydrogenase
MKDVARAVRVLDLISGAVCERNNGECAFVYRGSVFKEVRELILTARLQLVQWDRERTMPLLLSALRRKQAEQPMNTLSEGCIFKNFELADAGEEMQARLRAQGVPEAFLTAQRIPAGWLIEQCGLKGVAWGAVQVSSRHANFLIHNGTATAKDVCAAIARIKEAVHARFAIALREEVNFIG